MVQNAKMKNIGKMLLSWAAVIVLVVAVVIFTSTLACGCSNNPVYYVFVFTDNVFDSCM